MSAARVAVARAALAALAALAAACTQESPVLFVADADPGVLIKDCDQAFGAPEGLPCSPELRCTRPSADDPLCCSEFALCVEGRLVADRVCDAACKPCPDDRACAPGVEICEGNVCQKCAPDGMCPPCEPGFEPLRRNGCVTCTCAPPSECPPLGACGPEEKCYPGATCAPGCLPDDAACCANVCAASTPACPSPAPLGCKQACTDPPSPGCDTCVAIACDCVGGQWVCTPGCGTTPATCALP